MDYYTSAELAKKWNVTQRWISILCKRGELKGAILRGNTWFIPKDVERTEDRRYKRQKQDS